jgi:two-component system, OmpR family, response regulator VicR
MSNTILLVEDDAMIASGLCYALEQEGYTVTHCATITAAKKAAERHASDLALLDMQLPDGTGFDIIDKLKSTGTSVIFLTVVDDEGNIVKAFEGGADDYVTKPFRLRELLARVKSVLARHGKQATDRLMLGSVTVDVSAGKAYKNGTMLDLTALEYRLLLTFAANKGQILSRSQILENLWDSAGNFVEDNTLTVYIKRLREKLGEAASIETVRGMGYKAT